MKTIIILECEDKPCQNGGICVKNENGFTCDCTKVNYTGSLCEISITTTTTKTAGKMD